MKTLLEINTSSIYSKHVLFHLMMHSLPGKEGNAFKLTLHFYEKIREGKLLLATTTIWIGGSIAIRFKQCKRVISL